MIHQIENNNLSEIEFDQEGIVLLYFDDSVLPPYEYQMPAIQELSDKHSVCIGIVDGENENEQLFEQFDITSVPTFVLTVFGPELKRDIGRKSVNELLEFIKPY